MEVIVQASATRTPFDNLGKAAVVAYHPQAPVDEVEDAGQMLMKAYQGFGLPNQLDITTIVQQTVRLKRAEEHGNRLLSKAITMLHPDAATQKARTEPWVTRVGGGGKWIPKPGIPALVLRQLAKRIEVAQAIHRVWQRKVKLFAQPSTKPDEPGFQLYHLDPGAKLDDRQNDYLHWLSQFLANGGRDFDARARKMARRQTLPVFLQRLVNDSLTFDLGAVEKVPLRGDPRLDSFYCRDGATFFLANFGPTVEERETFAYQIAYGTEEIAFSVDELALWQRNVDSDLNSGGYGISELEASVDTLSNWITSMQYTKEGMDNNAIPRGILSVFGQFDRQTKQLFQQAWDSKLRGVMNAFKLPVLFGQPGQTGDVKFTATGEPFNEMAFAKWVSLQASIMGAIYGTDPKEIGLDSFTSQNTSSLNGNDTEEKLLHSRDTNFNPVMHDLAAFLKDELVSPFGDWIGLRFNGLISDDATKRQEEKRRMMTINESRKELGMDPYPISWIGNLPADPKMMDAEFQRLNATATYDELRQCWGGFKVYPSELVGLAPVNPSLGALYNMAAQAAGADSGGGDEGGDADPENPFGAMDPGKAQEGPEGGQEGADGEDGGEGKPGLFDEDPGAAQGQDGAEDEGTLKGDVAAKLKQV